MKRWFIRNFICRFWGHIDGVKMPLFVPWKGQIEENRKRSIPVFQNNGPDGPHDFYPEAGVATALNEPLDYSTPPLFFVESTAHGTGDWYREKWLERKQAQERGSIHCKRCGAMIGEY